MIINFYVNAGFKLSHRVQHSFTLIHFTCYAQREA